MVDVHKYTLTLTYTHEKPPWEGMHTHLVIGTQCGDGLCVLKILIRE